MGAKAVRVVIGALAWNFASVSRRGAVVCVVLRLTLCLQMEIQHMQQQMGALAHFPEPFHSSADPSN